MLLPTPKFQAHVAFTSCPAAAFIASSSLFSLPSQEKSISSRMKHSSSSAAAADLAAVNPLARCGFVPVVILAAAAFSFSLLYATPWRFSTAPPALQLDEILQAADMGNRTVILTTLNAAWTSPGSVLDLFFKSFRAGNGTAGLLNHMVIIAVDRRAYERCRAVHSYCFELNVTGVNLSQQKDYNTPDYLDIMWRRLDFQRRVLQKGYSFIFTDTDILWFRNPLPHFYRDADFQVSCDVFNGNATDLDNMPSNGFNYVRSNNRTVAFFDYWYGARLKYPRDHDQGVLNYIKHDAYLADLALSIRFLDTKYFNGLCEPKGRDWSTICTFHANCRVGLSSKLSELRAALEGWKQYIAKQLH